MLLQPMSLCLTCDSRNNERRKPAQHRLSNVLYSMRVFVSELNSHRRRHGCNPIDRLMG